VSATRPDTAHRRPRRILPLRRGVYLLPNIVTSIGLLAGFYSIIATMNGQFWMAAAMILVAQCCDVLDGRIARFARASSSFGMQYDSLADLISFGVAPAVLVYAWALHPFGRWGWLAAALYATCGALRLARYNVQVTSVERRHFLGLPIPAAAAVIATTVLLHFDLGGQGAAHRPLLMLAIVYVLAGLMVSEIRYFSFKDFHLHRRHPFPVLIGVIVTVLVTVGAPWPVLATAAVSYAGSGPVGALIRRARPGRGVTTGSSTAPHLRPVTVDKPPRRG